MSGYFAFYLALLYFGYTKPAFLLNLWVVSLEPAIALILSFTVAQKQNDDHFASPALSRKGTMMLYSMILLGFSLSSLPSFGVVEGGSLVFHGFLLNSLFNLKHGPLWASLTLAMTDHILQDLESIKRSESGAEIQTRSAS